MNRKRPPELIMSAHDHRTVNRKLSERSAAVGREMQAEWQRWGRNLPLNDHNVLAAYLPEIERGERPKIEEVAECLLEMLDAGTVSSATQEHLASRALWACRERGFPPSSALTELAARLLARKKPKHRRDKAEERQRTIDFIVENPGAGTGRKGTLGRREIAKAVGVSDATVRKWLQDIHFIDEVNERAGEERPQHPSDKRAP